MSKEVTAGSLHLTGTLQDAEACIVQNRHLATENRFLRARIEMVEASVQPLLREVSEKRTLLHHAYVLCHQHLQQHQQDGSILIGTGASKASEQVNSWARGGLASFLSRDAAQQEAELADAMEAVLEDTLRLNISLHEKLDHLTQLKP